MTKLDVLNDLDPIRICVGYRVNGKTLDYVPSNVEVLKFGGADLRRTARMEDRDQGRPNHFQSSGECAKVRPKDRGTDGNESHDDLRRLAERNETLGVANPFTETAEILTTKVQVEDRNSASGCLQWKSSIGRDPSRPEPLNYLLPVEDGSKKKKNRRFS